MNEKHSKDNLLGLGQQTHISSTQM
jgi:hypothetical protein